MRVVLIYAPTCTCTLINVQHLEFFFISYCCDLYDLYLTSGGYFFIFQYCDFNRTTNELCQKRYTVYDKILLLFSQKNDQIGK